jgi:hypothetical protein
MAKKPDLSPPLRIAPLGELNAYVVYEHDLDRLAQGSPALVMLNFALFFLGVAATAFGTLWTLRRQTQGVPEFLIAVNFFLDTGRPSVLNGAGVSSRAKPAGPATPGLL